MGLALTKGVLAHPEFATLLGVFPWSSHPEETYTQHEAPENHFRWFLKNQQIPILHFPSVNHFKFVQWLSQNQIHLVLVGSWGEIMKPYVFNIPEVRFINCHPSMLPLHRGPNPYTASILSGDDSTGVSFHQIDKGIDTGPLLLQKAVPILQTDTGETLRDRCAKAALEMMPQLLERLSNNTLPAFSQHEGGAYDTIHPDLGWLDWNAPPEYLDRQCRALYPWLPSLTKIKGKTVAFKYGQIKHLENVSEHILPGTIIASEKGALVVALNQHSSVLRLTGIRFTDYPAWMTPLLTQLFIKPGQQFSSLLTPSKTLIAAK